MEYDETNLYETPEPDEEREPMRVIRAIEQAFTRMRELMFDAFSVPRWLCFGVIIFLDALMTGSPQFLNINMPVALPGGSASDFEEFVENGREFVVNNLSLVVGGVVLGGLVLMVLSILVVWLSARGNLMLVRAVALGDHHLGRNWTETSSQVASLFWFRIVLDGAFFIAAVALVGSGAAIVLVEMAAGSTFEDLSFVPLVALGLVFLTASAVYAFARFLLRNFIVPLMWHFDMSAMRAWRLFGGIAGPNLAAIVGFFVVKVGVAIVGGFLGMVVGMCTCCIGWLPVLHQAVMSPFYVFERAFGMYVLASLGPDYDMFDDDAGGDDPFGEDAPRDLMDRGY